MEIWKDIKGYKGFYQVSSLGRVKSLKFNKERILKKGTTTRGYYFVQLYQKNKSKSFTIHKLVAMAFLNHIPDGYMLHIDHIDGNQLNNNVNNLEELTASEHRWKTIYTTGSGRVRKVKTPTKTSSKYRGVSWYSKSNKWRAQTNINGGRKHLGYFNTEIEAYLETKVYQTYSS